MKTKKSVKKEPVPVPVQEPVPVPVPVNPEDKMCTLRVGDLKVVCDWLNSDDMILPQNEVRKALAVLLSAQVVN